MKAGIVKFRDLMASPGINLDVNHWLDRTHDVDEEIFSAENRRRQVETKLEELRKRRALILAESEPCVRKIS